MIIKYIDEIEDRKEFINENKAEKILIKNYESNSFGRMKGIIADCNEVNKFLQIEIGSNFFFITQAGTTISSECAYHLSDRTMEDVIKEEFGE